MVATFIENVSTISLRNPQGLKPQKLLQLFGTTEVVP
jgi:hypothetical protein